MSHTFNILALCRKKVVSRTFSIALLLIMSAQLLIIPMEAHAVGGGPSQPEATSFKPVTFTDLVDKFSGDFNYNIPLLEVGGYPINLAYSSNVTPEQEASWVGLGWTLNPGSVSRNLRGIPDDFDGDKVNKQSNIKANHTFGLNLGISNELIGSDQKKIPKADQDTMKDFGKLSWEVNVNWNSYEGTGFEFGLSPTLLSGDKNKAGLTSKLSLKASSTSGVTISPTLSLPQKFQDQESCNTSKWTFGLGLPFNSRSGLGALSVTIDRDQDIKDAQKGFKAGQNFSELRDEAGTTGLSFSSPFYMPQIKMGMLNVSLNLSATIGLASYGYHSNIKARGYYSGQYLLDKDKSLPSYGYLNTHKGQKLNAVMLDFNREKDGAYSEFTPRLPLTSYTYDVFTVTGQGVGGAYRLRRNDVGVMFDNEVWNISAGLDFPGLEFGATSLMHIGLDFHLNQSDAYSGRWKDDNYIFDKFAALDASNGLYEAAYFKMEGEKVADDDDNFYNNIGKEFPVRVNLTDRDQEARNQIEGRDVPAIGFSENLKRNTASRAKRTQLMSMLNGREAQLFGLDRTIRIYDFMAPAESAKTALNDPVVIKRSTRPLHHLSELTVTKTDGTRYVYGVPAYNNIQEDVTFSIPTGMQTCMSKAPAIVPYSPGDNSLNNAQGRDHYFDKTTTPQYAHSYMLSAVLSEDYADATGDGPTNDDRGNYTRFNYSRVADYKWRTPFTKSDAPPKASYNPGIGMDKLDTKASYFYGEKDLWYVQSIETKDYIAVFFTEDRTDGKEAKGRDGGIGTRSSKLLKKIELYARSEYDNAIADGVDPVPVKAVHFSYDYGLCTGVPNNSANGGKLTLKAVWFTYGNSTRSANRGYKFTYASNPAYQDRSSDRWGYYKPETNGVSNADFPYSEQNRTLADQYAAAWLLSKITLPTGGEIEVTYEADDYAFVQDKRAMQMMTIVGSSRTLTEGNPMQNFSRTICSPGEAITRKYGELYEQSLTGVDASPNQYFYMRVPDPVADKEEVRRKYFSDQNGQELEYMFFRFNVKTDNGFSGDFDHPEDYETITGYIPRGDLDYGACTYDQVNGKSNYIWVRLKPVELGDYIPSGNANPIARAAWNFMKMRYPRKASLRAEYHPAKMNPFAIFGEIRSAIYQTYQMISGYYFSMRQRNLCRVFDCSKSMFRLYAGGYKKTGGGARVKQITMNDRFAALTGSSKYTNASYGKNYSYTTMLDNNTTISSGVASYEPVMGGEESPFRQPVSIKKNQRFMIPSEEYMQEGPFGESFMPGASVGYSKVTETSIRNQNSKSTATGKQEHEFYTAYDFPTVLQETPGEVWRDKPNIFLSFIKVFSRDYLAASQGYYIGLNDMHGKPKAERSYAQSEMNVPMTSVEYFYRRNPFNHKLLNNNVTTINNKGQVMTNRRMGVDVDIVADMREQKTRTRGGGVAANMDAFVAFFPVALPFIVPTYSQDNVMCRTSVVTKVGNRYGILDSTVAMDNGARKTMQNLVFDDESGDALVSVENNDFNDPVYTISYPAYWMHPEFSHAYKRMGATFSLAGLIANPASALYPGDEVIMGEYKGWVINVTPDLVIFNEKGVKYNLQELIDEEKVATLSVLRPANHNILNMPASKIVTKTNPVATQGQQLVLNNILDAQAKYFSDDWKVFCGCDNLVSKSYNPYINGRKGSLRVAREYLFLTERTQTKYNRNVNVRNDGTYTSFNPFWMYGGGWYNDTTNWIYTSENTIYSSLGASLESRDALGRYSGAQYAFSDRVPVNIGVNSMYREIGYDSFEDYLFSYNTCNEGHFTFMKAYKDITPGLIGDKTKITVSPDSHTGKYALKIGDQHNYIRLKRVLTPCK